MEKYYCDKKHQFKSLLIVILSFVTGCQVQTRLPARNLIDAKIFVKSLNIIFNMKYHFNLLKTVPIYKLYLHISI